MTLPASSAYQMTQHAASQMADDMVIDELNLVEMRISNATTRGLYEIVYPATKIGNPSSDPSVDSSLTPNQLSFRNTLQDSGYQVGRDDTSGYWKIGWSLNGAEEVVSVYQINTSVVPGSILVQTEAVITNYFANLSPSATCKVSLAGSAISGTYVHLAVVAQQNTLDLSSGLYTALISAGLGYNSGNTSTSKRS